MVLVNYLVQLLKKVCDALVETFTYCFTVAFVYISLYKKLCLLVSRLYSMCAKDDCF